MREPGPQAVELPILRHELTGFSESVYCPLGDASGAADSSPVAEADGSADAEGSTEPDAGVEGSGTAVGSGMSRDGIPATARTRTSTKMAMTAMTQLRARRSSRVGNAPR